MVTISASAGRSGVIRRATGRVTWSVPGMASTGPYRSVTEWIELGRPPRRPAPNGSGRPANRRGDQLGGREIRREKPFPGREADRQRRPLGQLDDGIVSGRRAVAGAGQRPVPPGEPQAQLLV